MAKISRRKKTQITWLAASALGAGVLWLFWKDIFQTPQTPTITVGKGGIKFIGKRFTRQDAANFKADAEDPVQISLRREQYKQQMIADGMTLVEVASALADYDSVK
jgi:hypothetical protein